MTPGELQCPNCGRIYNKGDLEGNFCPICKILMEPEADPNKILGDTLSLQLPWPPGQAAIRVGQTEGYLSAQLMKAALESEGIPVLLQGETSAQSLGIWVGSLGAVQISVPENLVIRAQEIIAITDK